jgi:D-arabinose 1-dehydrogenase-like Zn-dependent alcohol dehydrogenase
MIATCPEVKSATSGVPAATMRALVYRGAGKPSWELNPRPALRSASDAIVRITTSTICGTDLHILKGDLPSVTEGRILGHEGIGVVEETGAAVSAFHKGDKVSDLLHHDSRALECLPKPDLSAGARRG